MGAQDGVPEHFSMLALFLVLLIGFALGQRFKVLVLIPALLVGFLAVDIYCHAVAIIHTVWAFTIMAFCLQAGYVAGAGIRFLAPILRTGRIQADSFVDSST